MLQITTDNDLPQTPGKFLSTQTQSLTPQLRRMKERVVFGDILSPLRKTPQEKKRPIWGDTWQLLNTPTHPSVCPEKIINPFRIPKISEREKNVVVASKVVKPKYKTQPKIKSVVVCAGRKSLNRINRTSASARSHKQPNEIKVNTVGDKVCAKEEEKEARAVSNTQSIAVASHSTVCTEKEEEKETAKLTDARTITNQFSSTHTQPILQNHNFAHEITVQIQNDQFDAHDNNNRNVNKTITEVDDCVKRTSTADRTQIILSNKYVPKDVHLAIFVDKSKHISKNKLKKITRNLVTQYEMKKNETEKNDSQIETNMNMK